MPRRESTPARRRRTPSEHRRLGEILQVHRVFETAATQIAGLPESHATLLRKRLDLTREMIGPLDSLDRPCGGERRQSGWSRAT